MHGRLLKQKILPVLDVTGMTYVHLIVYDHRYRLNLPGPVKPWLTKCRLRQKPLA